MVSCAVIAILFFKNVKIRLLALFIFFLFSGIWRYSISFPKNTPDKIWYYNGGEATIVGTICNEPDVREINTKYEVCTEYFVSQNQYRFSISGKTLVTVNLYPVYYYGEKIKIIGEFQAPEKFNSFFYDRYLARYNIYSVCYYPRIEVLQSGGGNYFYRKIFYLKEKLHDAINRGLSEPDAGLAGAITLGYKKGISSYWQEKFSQVGISHIIAISGLHISILAALVMGFALSIGLPRQKAFWLASLFLLVYIFLIGLPASAMRAGVMGFLVLWAMNLGRLNKSTNSLVLVAVLLLLINPRLLRDDVGFQLSFLAVLGIIYFPPIFDGLLSKIIDIQKIPNFFKIIYEIFIITLAAQIFTLPIIAFNFSQISLIAPVSNLLVLWVLPPLVIAVFAGIILSLIAPALSPLFFSPAFFLLEYIMAVVGWLLKVPYAFVEINYFWKGWAVLYYLFFIFLIICIKNKKWLSKSTEKNMGKR
jgi:competence protein ComEC